MEFTIKKDSKFYATVEYDSDQKTLKMTDGTDQAKKDLPGKLKETFWIYDPRDRLKHKTKNPKDQFQAFLCIEQAMFGNKDFDVEFEGELWNGTLPDDVPGLDY